MTADDRIVHLEDVADPELADFYRACAFTIFPSLAEGWGLPVAESLATGKFCLASNATAIPEVGGDLVGYFDPADAEDCFRKIEDYILDRKRLAVAERRIKTGYRGRSWAACARRLSQHLAEFMNAPIDAERV